METSFADLRAAAGGGAFQVQLKGLQADIMDVLKVVEEGISAASAPAAKQYALLHRGGAPMCASKGNGVPAGEVPNAGGTKQQDFAVQKEKNKAYNGSSPGAAAGTGVQNNGSTTTKSQGAGLPGSEQMRGGASMCAPKGNEAPAGAVSARRDAKQQDSVVQPEKSKACNGSSPGAAVRAGAQCSGSTNTKSRNADLSGCGDKSECVFMCSDKSSAGAASATSGAKQ